MIIKFGKKPPIPLQKKLDDKTKIRDWIELIQVTPEENTDLYFEKDKGLKRLERHTG